MKQRDSEFKKQAVRLALTSSQSIAKTARDFGIKEVTLYNWVSNAKDKAETTSVDGQATDLVEELNRLRKENARWSMSDRMKEALVIDALKMEFFRRKIHSGLLIHSDCGS